MVGRPLEGRSYSLLTQPWLDLPALFAVGHDSPYYNEAEKMSVFYAESWALTHMLALGKDYISNFPLFLVTVSSGRPIEDCFQSVYGKSLAQVQKELHAYVTQSSVSAALFDVKLGKSDLEPEVSNPSDLEVDLALANLLASQTRTLPEAADRLGKLVQEHPENAEVRESLGYLQWAQGKPQEAVQSFQVASDRGSTNAEMFFHYAQLSMQTGAPAAQVVPILQRAVELKPDYQDAWFNLGMYSTNAGQFRVAIDAFNHIRNVTEEHAASFFSARAYCYYRMNARDLARQNAEQARKYAKTPQEQQQVSSLLRALEDASHPASAQPTADTMTEQRPTLRRTTPEGRELQLQHVDGIAKSFDCAAKPARLHVTVDGKEMIFAMDDPGSIVVRNSKSGFAEFSCGAQKPVKIGIFYAASSSADGSIRELVF
jgi:tetratricopeptide (TPR) repeat protein